ncbi:MAG: glycosyltransferase family 2 protein [Chitinispirillaceae bacterium]|nr:glycosyltransferase family 2 protein [Chitinispirillaceae bacterium]
MLTKICEIVFFLSLSFLAYSYILYPLLLFVLSSLFNKKTKIAEDYFPSVGVLVPAFNEEKVIRKKIDNILSLEYPQEKLSVWVGSDCSNDATDEIVKSYNDKKIHLWRAPERMGKTGILNNLAPLIDAEIILFTDANTIHCKESLAMLARHFADDTVGGVAGQIEHINLSEEEKGEHIYRSFESMLKQYESKLHSTISAYGGFYAIRKKLFKPIPYNSYSNDDVLIPINIIRQGYRMIYEPEAISKEDISGNIKSEFKRRIRIGAGNFQAFCWLLDFVNPLRGWPAFCLISHKFTRWFSPFFILFLIISSSILFFKSECDIYKAFFMSFSIIFLCGLLHKVIQLRFTKHIFYFFAMNLALLMGFFRFVKGIKSATWSRTERN